MIHSVGRAPWDCLVLILEAGNWISLMNSASNMWMLRVALFVISKNCRQMSFGAERSFGPCGLVVQQKNTRQWKEMDWYMQPYGWIPNAFAKSKGSDLWDSIYPAFCQKQNRKGRKQRNGCGWGQRLTTKGRGGTRGGNRTGFSPDCKALYNCMHLSNLAELCTPQKGILL